MISVITWKWKAAKEYRTKFTAKHVNTLYAMIKRNLQIPFKMICVTDDKKNIHPDIKIVDLWNEPIVEGMDPKKPNCYRRLNMFRPKEEIIDLFGERFISMDLDVVITGDLTGLFSRTEEFIAWNMEGVPYQGGFIMMTAGARPQVWNEFDPVASKPFAKECGYIGSDQAWISACLGAGNEKIVTQFDGLFSYKGHKIRHMQTLPKNAKIIFFHGEPDPWWPEIKHKHEWIREHYQIKPGELSQ